MDIPEKVRNLVDNGKKLVEDERKFQTIKFEEDRRQQLKDEQLRLRKSWGFLVVEAGHDLGTLGEYVNWEQPSDWKEEHHWFVVCIPGLSDIIAEYRKYPDSRCEWYLDHWGVATYECSNKTIFKTWVIYKDKPIDYILALAREQFDNKTALESDTVVHKAILEGQAVCRPSKQSKIQEDIVHADQIVS